MNLQKTKMPRGAKHRSGRQFGQAPKSPTVSIFSIARNKTLSDERSERGAQAERVSGVTECQGQSLTVKATPSHSTPNPSTPTKRNSDTTSLCGARGASSVCRSSVQAQQRRAMSLVRRQRGGCSGEPFRCSSAPSAKWIPLDLGAWLALRLCSPEIQRRAKRESASTVTQFHRGASTKKRQPLSRLAQNAFAPDVELCHSATA